MIAARDVEAAVGAMVAREGGAPDDWSVLLARYLELLLEWNRRVNLVSRRSIDRVLETQLRPSLASLLLVKPEGAVRVLDVGSGGGFPGIPLRILRPNARLDLVEARRKKCDFLSECLRSLDLADSRVHWCRVEEPSASLSERQPFDLVLARGVGASDRLAKASVPLLSPGGSAWVFADPEEHPDGMIWSDESGLPLTCLRRVATRPLV